MKSVREIQDLNNKKVLLRADFDVPVEEGKIGERFRIEKQKENLDFLLNAGARVTMIAHISAVSSFKDLLPQIEEVLGHKISFNNKDAALGLLDNIRQDPREEQNDEEFARSLAAGFDYYINNDFAVCHRSHASVSAIAKFLPGYVGLLVEKEVSELEKVIEAPKEGKLIIMGGAKAATKIPAIKSLLDKSEIILIGGVIANDVLKLRGYNIMQSVVDENPAGLFEGVDLYDARLQFPDDFAMGDDKILDIGLNTIKSYQDFIVKAKMIVWNGPMGLYENPQFTVGTNQIALAVVGAKAYKVIGGGDTIAAIDKMGLLDKFDFVSTGGGAMLDFLAGKELPGLKALGYGI